MQKLGFPNMKSLDHFKSLSGSSKNVSFSSRQKSESISMGSFANLKLTAEKLVQEQASVKTDLEIANNKLTKSTEHIHALEEKLQNAFNENAKLKVKQKEDEKLWKGLESKFCSTKTLADQLTETLQHLVSQVQSAEKDKEFFEGKISAGSNAIDNLNKQLNGLSLKLSHTEETIKEREKQLEELKTDKEEMNKIHADNLSRAASLIQEKDAMLKESEATVAAKVKETEMLNARIEQMDKNLGLKEYEIKHLMTIQENLAQEKNDLQLSSNNVANELAASLEEMKKLEAVLHVMAAQLVELDSQSLTFTKKFDHITSLYNKYFLLVHEEREFSAVHSKKQYDQLHDKFVYTTSGKEALYLENQDLKDKVHEIQKDQEAQTGRLAEDCRIAEERIKLLESEAEDLMSKKIETDSLVSNLEGKIHALSESSRSSENEMNELLSKISTLEMEKKANEEKFQEVIQNKDEEIVSLQKEKERYEQHANSLEKEIIQLRDILEEKEQLVLQYKDKEKKLEERINENQALLTGAESKLIEDKKQYEEMIASKQLELSRHLKEISQRNDQAINDIRTKYEMEKMEIIRMEKEKAEKLVLESEKRCDQRLAEQIEESRRQLLHIQEEHAALVLKIQQEHERQETSLKAKFSEELKSCKLQCQDELKEKMLQLKKDHEIQIEALRTLHTEECRTLQEELDLQKSKEEKQRALLQLQWKVMGDKQQEDQEVTSKKEYSVSSIKMKDPGQDNRSMQTRLRQPNREKESSYLGLTQTPVSKLLKKVENVNTGSMMSIPNHHKKVTRHEYEVETSNGRTITKRRRTKSTVMFEDPAKHKRRNTPKVKTPRSVFKVAKEGTTHPANIGDLFSEGSLNPYAADDPYAFD